MRCALAFLAIASALALELPTKKKASLDAERVSRSGVVTEDLVPDALTLPSVPEEASLAESNSKIVVTRNRHESSADGSIKGRVVGAGKSDTSGKTLTVAKQDAVSEIDITDVTTGKTVGKLIPAESMANTFVVPNKQTDTSSAGGRTLVITGPNQQMWGEDEDDVEEDEPKRPWLLQVLHDMLAPLHLPVIRGHPISTMQTTGNGKPVMEIGGAHLNLNGTDSKKSGENLQQEEQRRWHMLGGGNGYDFSEYSHLPKAMAARLSVQDVAVLASVMLFYVCTIFIALSLVYHTSSVSSGVKWFCEPEMLTTSSRTFNEFCAVFARAPETRVRVVVTNRAATKKRLDCRLDVTSLVDESDSADGSLEPSDAKTVMDFMRSGGSLSSLHIRKEVVWDGFESLEAKVAERVRELGLEGEVHVSLERSRDVVVRRNSQMFHFVHNQITSILVLMSIAGIFIFWPTVWLKKQNWYCTSSFRITTPADEYFPMLSAALPDALESAVESDDGVMHPGAFQ